jgi:serine/threonine-protein kinase
MAEERFSPGQQIHLYTLEKRIDSGGMGEVWKARKPDQVCVAIKFPHLQYAHDQRFRELVRREAAAQFNLHHPHIVAAEAVLEVDELPAIVFYYVDGPNLEQEVYGPDKLIDQGTPLPLERALRIATQILDALDYAHQNCYVHRDVKSSNILIERATDSAFLTDFGIVLNVAGPRLTRAGTVSGSVPYMSPEQITSPMSVNLRSDVYSFGVVLYEMLTGALPYRVEPGETTDPDFLIKEKHLKSEPAPPSSLNPAIPAELDRIVLRALEKQPDRRFLGCGDFVRRIRELDPERPSQGSSRKTGPVTRIVITEGVLKPPPPAPTPVFAEPPPLPEETGEAFSERIMRWLPWILFGASGLILAVAVALHLAAR